MDPKILLVVPVSAADFRLLDPFLSCLKAAGGAPTCPLLFVPTTTLASTVQKVARSCEDLALSVDVMPLDRDPQGGWPKAPNEHFLWSIIGLSKRQNQLPFYWLELDNTIMSPLWIEKLFVEYMMHKQAFMGAVVPTRKILNAPLSISEPTAPPPMPSVVSDETDPHMVGTGIYPGNIWGVCDGQVRDIKDESFDVHLRHYIMRSCHNTRLIQHMWSTVKYREEKGQVLCDNGPGNPFGTNHAGPVDPQAMVVHGCKDGSLASVVLVRAGRKVEAFLDASQKVIMPASKPVVASSPVRTPLNQAPVQPVGVPTAGNDDVMAREWQRLQATEAEMKRRQIEDAAKIQAEVDRLKDVSLPPKAAPIAPISSEPESSLLVQAKALLSEKKYTLKALSKSLDADQDLLQATLEKIGVTPKTNAGWLELQPA